MEWCRIYVYVRIYVHVFIMSLHFPFSSLHPTVARFALFTLTVCWLQHPGLSLHAPQIISYPVTAEMAILQLAALIMLNVQRYTVFCARNFREKVQHQTPNVILLRSPHMRGSDNSEFLHNCITLFYEIEVSFQRKMAE